MRRQRLGKGAEHQPIFITLPGVVLTCDARAVPSSVWWLLLSIWDVLILCSLRSSSARSRETEETEACQSANLQQQKSTSPASHPAHTGSAARSWHEPLRKVSLRFVINTHEEVLRARANICLVLDDSICLPRLRAPQQP